VKHFFWLLCISMGSAAELRVACNARLAGWMRPSAEDSSLSSLLRIKRAALDYYKSLGFTHILYPMEIPYVPAFKKGAQGWTYNGGTYAEGDHAESLATMKKEVEARGMSLVPALQSLSHVEAFIKLDPSISEFDRLHPKPPAPWLWRKEARDRYAGYDGVAQAGPLGTNPGADQFFREYLRIIKAVWEKQGGPGAHPAQILIGHDELGYASVGFIKAGRSRPRPESAAELVALEIKARCDQAREILGDSAAVWLWADSFVPGDYGETYGLAGDAQTGEGGVLRLLAERHGLGGRLTVIPWAYSSLESDAADDGRKLIISKAKQLAYLDRVGVPFILGTGEDQTSPYAPFVERTKQCLFEWVAEGRKRTGLRGYAHMTFDNFESCAVLPGSATPVCAGFSAPLLAYLAWSGKPGPARRYSPVAYSGVDYLKSRWELSWKAGVHYPAGE
jgi:hypothetical protein